MTFQHSIDWFWHRVEKEKQNQRREKKGVCERTHLFNRIIKKFFFFTVISTKSKPELRDEHRDELCSPQSKSFSSSFFPLTFHCIEYIYLYIYIYTYLFLFIYIICIICGVQSLVYRPEH